MTTTLVTGAAGFTGRYVVAALAERGHMVHGTVHEAEFEPVPGLAHAHLADLADLPRMQEVVEQVRPDHVVHLAAIAFVAHGDVGQLYRSNLVGTRQLLEALARSSATPRSVILASSANVYGNAREGRLDEDVPPCPANDYGISKWAVEQVARLYSSLLPIIVVRPFNYTGVGQSEAFLIPKIVAHARQGKSIVELGNLDVARDYSDVRTVADAYVRLLDCAACIGETYNICSGRAVSLETIVEKVRSISGIGLDVAVNPDFVRPNEVKSLCGSVAKLESAIGKLNAIPLDDTIRWMLEA